MSKKIYTIDGAKFANFEEFRDTLNQEFAFTLEWNGNFDALSDLLEGGYGTPEEGFIVRWLNFGQSKDALGYQETLHWLESVLSRVHPSGRESWETRIALSKQNQGEALWMSVVDVITNHKHIDLQIIP